MNIAGATITSAGAVAAAALILKHEQRGRNSAERFAAASLETLLNAIDANDAETGAHVRRVASYALILAEEADLDEAQRRSVERIALFHDIGKIHEALFDIIHDGRKLSAYDRRAIATHPERGAKVLAPLCGFYPELPDGVLSHHERWDGRGYPRQLKGRRIPIGARIVSIADTFDAITHTRPYRSGRSAQFALEVIAEGRGKQWDPALVDLFMFPPVFERITGTLDEVAGWRSPVQQRRTGRDEDQVPDVTFRWRPGRHGGSGNRGGRGRPASDRKRQTGR